MSETPTPAIVPGTGADGQTFLVGNEVYLRTLVPGDEKNATSWRRSVFPKAPELIEKWIKEDLPKEGKRQRGHMAIVRKSDDVLIGSMVFHHGDVAIRATAYVDPLYGDQGERWLAEAVLLAAEWQVEENHTPSFILELSAEKHIAIAGLIAAGFVETARWRQMREINGQRVDLLNLSRFNQAWVDRLGDPLLTELPRTGTGEARPVPAKVVLEGDPPAQAVAVGKRVYLRPEDKNDAKRYFEGSRLEEETFFDIGRHLVTEASWQRFISGSAGEDYPRNLWFAVCLRETDEVIGSVGLIGVSYVHRSAETGSFFHEKKWRGDGYGSEAKQLLLEYSFDVLGLHMVQSYVYFPNTRSAAALRKQGYTEAGRVCWLYTYEGGFGNMVTFDLLAEEWRALPREA